MKNNALGKKRDDLLRKVAGFSQWIEGTLVNTARICGRKNCACHTSGQKHPVIYITWKENGKTVSLYVPRKLESDVREWAEKQSPSQMQTVLKPLRLWQVTGVRTVAIH